mmetsp:Transcript_42719/g.86379  ORF Transcript_42719/g.86379 Transcript_42719/m.86379 type:complete len:117 (+) Transcript_42719:41-391(+)
MFCMPWASSKCTAVDPPRPPPPPPGNIRPRSDSNVSEGANIENQKAAAPGEIPKSTLRTSSQVAHGYAAPKEGSRNGSFTARSPSFTGSVNSDRSFSTKELEASGVKLDANEYDDI